MQPVETIIKRGFVALFILLMLPLSGISQNLVITNNTSASGTGTIKLTGHIDNSATTKIDTIRNFVSLVGTSAESIGVSGKSAIHFGGLEANGTANNMALAVDARVLDTLSVKAGTLVVNGKTLTLDSATNHSGGTFNAATGTVVYQNNRATYTQSIVGATYNVLTLSNAAKKNINDAAVITSGALTHGGGGLSVNKALTVQAGYTIGTIDSIGSSSTATLSATGGSIATLTDVKSGSTLQNGNGTLTISSAITDNHGSIINGTSNIAVTGTLVDNHGTIQASSNNGPMTFTNVTNNHGSITGGNGAVTFTNFLVNNGNITGGAGLVTFTLPTTPFTDSSGIVLAGSGDILFGGQVNINGGTVRSTAAADSLRFNGILNVNNGGTLQLTNDGTAVATAAVTKNSGGAMTFNAASKFHYRGTGQSIASASYGNLLLNGSGTALGNAGNVTVQDSITVNQLFQMSAGDTVVLASASAGRNVQGSNYIRGAVKRSTLNANTFYAFNRDSVGMRADAALSNITLNMQPDSIFSDSTGFTTYAKRYFGVGGSFGSANLTELSLAYAQSEVVPASAFTSQFGLRSHTGTSWTKIANTAGYTRNVDSVNGIVHLSGTLSALSGVNEFGIMKNTKETKQTGLWSAGTTWDDGVAPISTDDVEIGKGNATVTVDVASTANSVLILASPLGTLNVSSANLTVNGLVDLRGTLSVSNGRVLTINGGNFRLDGGLTNNGTIDIH